RHLWASGAALAQMARAPARHRVTATQRPPDYGITARSEPNVPARLPDARAGARRSGAIPGQIGAERLLGKGDMLLLGPSSSIAQRIQGSWVTEEEVRAIAAFWKRQATELDYADEVQGNDDDAGSGSSFGTGSSGGGGGGASDDD